VTGDRPLPRPRKRLGQHFLSDRRILARIADALEMTGTETVVEIGPGRGALTEALAERAARVVAVELDGALAAMLRARYAGSDRVQIVEADVLDVSLAELAGGPGYVLAGNVPYYITTPILFHALEPPRPDRAVFLVQREVAERVVAPPGSKTYGALSVNVQAVAHAEVAFRVPAGAFHPPPKVESAVLRLRPRAVPDVLPDEEVGVRRLVQDAFAMRRKQLRRVLRSVAAVDVERAEAVLAACGIDPEARPETLAPADFARLYRELRGPRP
jgi:16S rRNA (adenine1518-N6/adenine1519-N6)-dimethyltransferase